MKRSIIALLIILLLVVGMATNVQAESVVSIGDCLSFYINTGCGMEFEWVVRPVGDSFSYKVYWCDEDEIVQLDDYSYPAGHFIIEMPNKVGTTLMKYGYYYIQISSEVTSILVLPASLYERGTTEITSEKGLVIVSNMDTRWYLATCSSILGPPPVKDEDLFEMSEGGFVIDPWIGIPGRE